MPTLGQIIREIQHAAAALPTDALRHEIELNLEVQDAAIDLYYTIPPGGRTVEDLIIANSTVMVSVLTTALYVRELTTRPAVTSVAVVISPELARTNAGARRSRYSPWPGWGSRQAPYHASNLSERKLRHA